MDSNPRSPVEDSIFSRPPRKPATNKPAHADSLIEAALRYVIVQRAVSTVLVGYSTLEQLEYAARSIEKGPLSPAALDRVADIQRGFVGEPR